MFLLFLVFIRSKPSNSIINIDIGSQYLKFGETNIDNGFCVVRKIYNKFIVPGLISLITPQDLELPLTSELVSKTPVISASEQSGSSRSKRKINTISVITGWKGLQQIHRYPKSGSEFIINSVLNRESPSDVLNTSSLLDLLMINLLHDMPESEGIKRFSLTFPTFFTPSMKKLITEPLRQIPNFEIVEEFDTLRALSTLYANMYINRYRNSKQGRNVLFINIGFQYVETLFVNFQWKKTITVADCISNLWSDKCGTRAFTEDASKNLHIPFSHAERILRSTFNHTIFNKDLVNSLKNLVNETFASTKQLIDEVQLIGGGSSYYFIQSIITDVVNGSFRMNATRYNADKTQSYLRMQNQKKLVGPEKKIFLLDVSSKDSTFDKDLKNTLMNSSRSDSNIVSTEIDQFDGVLIGSMFSTLYNNNNRQANDNPISIKKEKPSHSYYLTIGDKKVKYCEKNSWCQPQPSFESTTGAPNYTVSIAFEGDTTDDVSHVANRYRLTDLEKFISENKGDENDYSAHFTMRSPEPYINDVKWCKGDDNCRQISFEMENGDDLTNEILRNENYDIVKIFYSKLTESKEREQFNTKTKRAFDRMKMLCSKNEKSACTELRVIQQRYANGEFEIISLKELEEEIIPKISSLCKSLGFRYD